MELKVRQLEVFRAVVETGSVTAAAVRLHCTQPAVSIALAKFEKASGLTLFDRVRGRFVPTPEGEALYAEVERGLVSLGRIASKANELRHGRVGHLSIGTDGAITLAAKVVAAFQQSHGDVTIDLYLRPSKEIVTWISNRQLDIGIVEGVVQWPGVAFEPFSQPCVCLVPGDHPLSSMSVISPSDLAGVPLIGIGEHHLVDIQLAEMLAREGVKPTKRINAEYFETCKQLVRHGAGVAVVGVASHEAGLGDGIVALPFDPVLSYDMSIVTPARPGPSAVARLFVDDLRAELESIRID